MIPTETVKLNGKDYPFHFGVGATRLYAIKTGNGGNKFTEIEKVLDDATVENIDVLIWCGLKSGAAKNNEQLDISVEDVSDIFNEDPIAVDKCLELLFGVAEEMKKQAANIPENDEKKSGN